MIRNLCYKRDIAIFHETMIISLNNAQSSMTGRQEQIGCSSFILHHKARQHFWEGVGALSLKTFFHGQSFYTVGRGYHAVDDTSYLILNHEQPYTITLESETPVESFCVFFAAGFAEEVQRSLVTPTDRLLDNLDMPHTAPILFFERTYPHDDLVSPALLQLRSALLHKRYEQGWLEESFHEIVQRLLQAHQRVYKEVESLPALRVTTREEVYRRLYRARDYACALFDQPVTLADMAHVAGLSPNHFLRLFKQVFHQTPHQYLITKRLEHARQLLVQTERSITDICFAVGFESLGSFSWLFRQRIGNSPEAYRLQESPKK